MGGESGAEWRHTILITSSKKIYKWPLSTWKNIQGFPGGSVVKSPPARAGDTHWTPGPGGSHGLQSNGAHAPPESRPLSPELQLLRAESSQLCNERGPATEAHTPQLEKSPGNIKDPAQPQINT